MNVNFKKNDIFLLHQESSILECSYFYSVTYGRNSEIKQLWPVTDQVYVSFRSNDFWPSYGPWTLKFGQIFSCHHFLAHLAFRPYELLPSLFVRHPSVNISHFNLLRNHRSNCNQTLVEWSLGGPLPKLCPVIPTSNQDGRQAQNRKKGGMKF